MDERDKHAAVIQRYVAGMPVDAAELADAVVATAAQQSAEQPRDATSPASGSRYEGLLVRALFDPEAIVRERSAGRLADVEGLGAAAIEALAAVAANDDDNEVRAAARSALRAAGVRSSLEAPAITALADAAAQSDAEVSETGRGALRHALQRLAGAELLRRALAAWPRTTAAARELVSALDLQTAPAARSVALQPQVVIGGEGALRFRGGPSEPAGAAPAHPREMTLVAQGAHLRASLAFASGGWTLFLRGGALPEGSTAAVAVAEAEPPLLLRADAQVVNGAVTISLSEDEASLLADAVTAGARPRVFHEHE